MEIKLDWDKLPWDIFKTATQTIKDKVFLLKAVLIQTHQSLRSSAFVYHQGLNRLSQGRSFFRRNEQLIWNCLRSQSRHRTKTVCFSEIRIYSLIGPLCSGTRRLWKQLITMLDRRPTCLGDMERSDQRSRCQSKAASEWFLEQKKLFIEQLFQSFGNGCSSAVEHLWFRVLVPECWAFFLIVQVSPYSRPLAD